MRNESGTVGAGGLTLLGIAFVVLKLTGEVTWSWWWVLAPFWIPGSFLLGMVGLIVIVAGCIDDD